MISDLSPDRIARIRLSAVVEPLDRVVTPALINRSAEQAWREVQEGLSGRFARCRARAQAMDLDRLLRSVELLGIRAVIPTDSEWPSSLDDLAVPPWCLWVRGASPLDQLVQSAVAMVGSRAATPYGSTVARTMATDLSELRHTVVSGAAFGIDAAAHEGALAVGAPTVAALACGLDRAYPAAHRDLLERTAATGAVVSEYPPGFTPMKHRFLSRNRIIAALSDATVVVEAGLRSGSLNTAGYAVDLGRTVAAVPGPVTSATSAGTNELIRQGAQLVCDASEVIELIAPVGTAVSAERREPDTLLDLVSEVAGRTRDAFPAHRLVSVDQLVSRAGLAVGEVLAGLGELQSLGVVQQGDLGGWKLTRSGYR